MTFRTFARPRVAGLAAIAAAIAAFVVPTVAQAAPPEGRVKVMTRNLYLGADLTPAIQAGSLGALAVAAQNIWNDVIATKFPDRAKLLAKEIKDAKPDLVGLQEVALWRGDFNNTIDGPDMNTDPDPDGPATPATTVKYDFLALLKKQLDKQDAPYKIVRTQKEADIEAPLAFPGGDIPYDGRLTMRDVVLARKGAGISTMYDYSQRFDNNLVVEDVGGPSGIDVTVWRGFIAMDVDVRGTQFRFVNTHLEAFDNDAKLAQAQELVTPPPAEYGPAYPGGVETPVVLVGDLNSDDEIVETLGDTPGHQADELPYAALVNAGLEERSFDGLNTDGNDALFSCCFDDDDNDRNPIDEGPPVSLPDIDHTVDHVMVSDDDPGAGNDPNSNDIDLVNSFNTGNEVAEFNRFGIWASDHLGMVSSLQFP